MMWLVAGIVGAGIGSLMTVLGLAILFGGDRDTD